MLTHQRRKYPEVATDYGIYYENETCAVQNWTQLWSKCTSVTPPKRLYVCKASYHETVDNQLVVDGLASLPAKVYNYAPDTLCTAEGCSVRLVQNVGISSGLVNSACGVVRKIVYHNADVRGLLDGKHPAPYCIIVEFGQFYGFLEQTPSGERRVFPFTDHTNWVPVYRKKFSVCARDLPVWIRKKQLPKDCYRMQFP